jgi:hypothetical protein
MTRTAEPQWEALSKTWGPADAVRIFATGWIP